VRSRLRERLRLRAPVETTDPAALAAYAKQLRPVVVLLRELAEDATAPADKRVHSRAFLRRDMLRALREVEARLDVAEHGDPAGCGGSPAL
jgi:hypothetical protein